MQIHPIIDPRIESGSAAGQMLFWDGSEWVHTETSELDWDDTSKILVASGLTVTGNSVLGLNSAVFQPAAGGDSTTFFQIKNAAGTQVMGFDTSNGRMIIGTGEPGALLEINAGSNKKIQLGDSTGVYSTVGVFKDLTTLGPVINLSRTSDGNFVNSLFSYTATAKFNIGLHARHDLVIATAGVEKMRILDNGNVGFNEIAPETLLELTHAEPYLTLHNETHENSDGGRESRIIFKGEKTDESEHTLAMIEVGHDGTGNDQKGYLDIYINDGNDGDLPITHVVTINSAGRFGAGTKSPNAPAEVKGSLPGYVGNFHSGILHVTNASNSEFANAVITGHNSYTTPGDEVGNTQLWYLGSTTGDNNDIAFINRQDGALTFKTNNITALRIESNQEVTFTQVVTGVFPTVGDHFATKEYVDLTLGAQKVFFLSDTGSGVGSLNYAYPRETGDDRSTIVTDPALGADDPDPQLIKGFITETGEPATTTIYAGVVIFHLHAKKGNTNQRTTVLNAVLSKVAVDGTSSKVTITTTENSAELTDTETAYILHATLDVDVEILSTDRLILDVYASVGSGAQDAVITLYMEGTEDSYFTTKVDSGIWQNHGDVLDDLNTLGQVGADSEFLVGTGAGALAWEDAATARTSLGLVIGTDVLANIVEDAAPELGGEMDAGAHTIGFTQQSTTGDGTTTINWTLGNKFYFTFGAQNDTFTFTAPSNPCNLILVLKQDGNGGGSRLATWPGTVLWPAGTAPTLSTGAGDVDIVSFYYDGTNYFGNTSKDFG